MDHPSRGCTGKTAAKTGNGTCMACLPECMASLPGALPDYAELHALSNFSFLRAASHPEELVQRAHVLGYRALALTDECSLAGSARAHFAAKECGLHLIHGTELRVEGSHFVLLANDRVSYGSIASLITTGRSRAKKGTYALTLPDLEKVNALVLWVAGEDPWMAPWLAER